MAMTTTNSLGMRMVVIPPGRFTMGTSDAQIDALSEQVMRADPTIAKEKFSELRREQPQHVVTLTKPILLAAHEVTVGQFREFVEATKHRPASEVVGTRGWKGPNENQAFDATFNWRNPGYPVSDRHPVGSVSWEDAVAFCNWLSDREKLPRHYQAHLTLGWVSVGGPGYRLPTEAEWEFAVRAGTTTLWPWGDVAYSGSGPSIELKQYATVARDELAGQMVPVGTMPANPFGLYDVLGNVAEWCQDWYATDYSADAAGAVDPEAHSVTGQHVYRGLASSGLYMRPGYRNSATTPDHRIGFRVARDAAPVSATGR
jgi:formylglycine-generating enzyme required for sulfatase activity